MSRRPALALLVLLPALSARAEATPVCNAPARLVQWPLPDPKWEFCMLSPQDSSGTSGSGIDLYDVFYNGHLVFKRAHAPILNVLYAPGGCGCFRDWSDQEQPFEAITATGPASSPGGGFVDVVVPPRTVCEAGGGVDLGSFAGVAAERGPSELVLTTQMSAGWYRYEMKWTFGLDGSFGGWFGFAAVSASCVSSDHTHHNYWRLDFDIDGAAHDSVEMVRHGSVVPPNNAPGSRHLWAGREGVWHEDPERTWQVRDTQSGRGYRLAPGPSLAPDLFAVSDYWFLQYSPSEITDSGQPGPSCAIKMSNFVGSTVPVVDTDVVVWVRGGQFHQGGDLDDCHVTSFSFTPVGNWSP